MKRIRDNKPIKILLFEDNPGDVCLFLETLREIPSTRYETIHVDSLAQGILLLDKQHIDIITLDLGLPNSHHLESLKKLKSLEPRIPIVILIGNDDEETALFAVQQGAQDYLVKQKINADALSRAIHYSIERQKLQDKLFSLALIDYLTGLYNRRGFFTLAEHHLKLAERMNKICHLLFLDIDNLKTINDNYGHFQGDLYLKKTAEILIHSFRDSDIISRIGGDEFVVLIPDTSTQGAQNTVSRFQNNINEVNKREGLNLSVSVGIATFSPNTNLSLQELLNKADKNLYDKRRKEKNGRGERI